MFTIQRNTVSSDYKYLSITIVLSVYLDDIETSVFAAGSAHDRGVFDGRLLVILKNKEGFIW